ncbi:MAG: ABC transporter ATP-binding protein [Acidimicrobiales bacterium]|nr:ABC transporter ATP-binding protein [Acidimicrobiales bacterium]
MFEAAELSFTYPSGRRGLGKVSLKGTPGDRVVVMGPNGSGKSTLLRLVSTELPARPGSLELFGEAWGSSSSDSRKRRDLRKRIGIVQDTPVHVEDLTGMENGLLFAELYGLPRAEALAAFASLFTALGLDDALHVPTREYSYGMKKKLLIAEALVHDPDLLIMDEPVLGLDPPSRAALLRTLEERTGKGVCTLTATNEPALAQELATTVVLLHEGEVVALGSPAELLAEVGNTTLIEVHVAGAPDPTKLDPALAKGSAQLPADIVSIRQIPGRIIAESRSGSDVLPQLVGAVLAEGLRVERVEIREPDLTDVFTRFTGQALGGESP